MVIYNPNTQVYNMPNNIDDNIVVTMKLQLVFKILLISIFYL